MDHMIHNLVHSPMFSHQLLALPQKAIPQILEKIELLRVSPAPDAKNKKRLTSYEGNIFRLRSGDFRIIYTFDAREGWVGIGGCAVLVATHQAGFEMARQLTACGLVAKHMERQEIELDLPVINVITRHSAKGLEFTIVVVTGHAGAVPWLVPGGATDDQREEAWSMERRILYVAMTRAMDRLLVVASPDHPLLGAPDFDPEWWNHGTTA